MALIFQNSSVTKLARLGIATLLVFAMAACGGGGGSAGSTIGTGSGGSTGGTGSSTDGTVMVALMNTVGVESNSVSSGKPLVAKATVKDANGVAVKNTVVTFTLSSAVATMSPSTGTALTDSSGVAQISIEAGSSQGAATVTASAIAGGSTAVTSLASFAVGAAPSATPAATKTTAPAAPAAQGVNGTFTGPTVNVNYGNVQVQIVVKDGKIIDATALQAPSGRNDRWTNMALPILKKQTLAAQSASIQGASGASYTSYGWYTSLQGALAKAGL